MKVFYSNDFKGHWPVGTAAVVVAPDVATAHETLAEKLRSQGLPGDKFTILEVHLDEPEVFILCNGEY